MGAADEDSGERYQRARWALRASPRCSGPRVVGISRNPSRVAVDVPVIAADATRRDDLAPALEGIEVAYLMIHSLEAGNTDG